MPIFEVYKSPAGYRWRLKAGNGVVMAISHAFASKEGAEDGFLAACHNAAVIDFSS